MYFYFYKITNLVNGKFYYGVHQAESLDDGYLGSGVYLMKARKKYGDENFKKEILKFFSSRDEMFDYEKNAITGDLLLDERCYNLKPGGLGGWALTPDQRERARLGLVKFFEKEENRKRTSRLTKEAMTRPDVRENLKMSQAKKTQTMKVTNQKDDVKKRRSKAIRKAMESEDVRLRIGESLRNNPSYHESMRKMGERQRGYNNPEFLFKYKAIYEKDMDDICQLLIETDLPDNFIIYSLFEKQVKAPRLLAYYESIGKLPGKKRQERKARFLSMENTIHCHLDGGSIKTWYGDGPWVKVRLLHEDLLAEIPRIISLSERPEISDMMVIRGQVPEYPARLFTVIDYLEDIGILSKTETELRLPTVRNGKAKTKDGKQITVRSRKTTVNINYAGLRCIFIDKEFNQYAFDNDGRLVPKGRFQLQVHGAL